MYYKNFFSNRNIRIHILVLCLFSLLLNGELLKADGGVHSREQIEFTKSMIEQKKEPWYSAYKQLMSKVNSDIIGINRVPHPVEVFIGYNIYSATEAQKKINK